MPHTFTPEKMRSEFLEVADNEKSYGMEYEEYSSFLSSPENKVFRDEVYPENAFELDQDKVADWWIAKFEAYKAELRKEIDTYVKNLAEITPNGELPFVVFGGKADEKEKWSIYLQAVRDIKSLPLLASNTKEV